MHAQLLITRLAEENAAEVQKRFRSNCFRISGVSKLLIEPSYVIAILGHGRFLKVFISRFC